MHVPTFQQGSLAAVVALASAGCVTQPTPLAMAPARWVALDVAKSEQTIAVLDFTDARPDFERSAAFFDERAIGGRWWARDRFFSFHPVDAGLAADPAMPPDIRARVLGAAAFRWYPFPNHGIGKPLAAASAIGLSDYVALALEQRGIFARVVRAPDAATAREAGATLFLEGTIDRFGALLAESRDPFVVRPDDWTEYQLLAATDYSVRLTTSDGSTPLFTRECVGRSDDLHLFDRLTPFRGSQSRPLYQLDATDFPADALGDMGDHARRSLEQATAPLIASLEEIAGPASGAP